MSLNDAERELLATWALSASRSEIMHYLHHLSAELDMGVRGTTTIERREARDEILAERTILERIATGHGIPTTYLLAARKTRGRQYLDGEGCLVRTVDWESARHNDPAWQRGGLRDSPNYELFAEVLPHA